MVMNEVGIKTDITNSVDGFKGNASIDATALTGNSNSFDAITDDEV